MTLGGADTLGSSSNSGTKRASLAVALVTVSLCLLWIAVSKYAVPPVIAKAYRGESLPVLNGLITSQASHPLAEYFATWQKISWRLLQGLALAGLLGVVVLQPKVQTVLWGRTEPAPRASSPIVPLARPRILMIDMLMGLLILGSLFNIVMDVEHWPFSNYPMYSFEEKSRSLTKFRLYGVTQEQPLQEFPLIQFQYTQPFDNSRLNYAFASIYLYKYPGRERDLHDAVQNCFQRYEALRQAGRHHGPPLQAMRLYQVYWVLDPWARNVDRPDSEELVVEVTQTEIKEH
jgi:hypothetical protein